jgi:hypothetical protein
MFDQDTLRSPWKRARKAFLRWPSLIMIYTLSIVELFFGMPNYGTFPAKRLTRSVEINLLRKAEPDPWGHRGPD